MLDLTNKEIDYLLDKTLEQAEIDNNMPKMEKRKRIYKYLINTKEYNYEYFEGILRNYEKATKERFQRNLQKEFQEPLLTNKGICNGFAQVYKLLLEKIGIYSICVNCMIKHEEKFVGHQLNLVYDEEAKTYSFDDVTFGIIKKSTDYFNYDNPKEKEEQQGIIPIYDDIKWLIIDDDLINYYAKREKHPIEPPIKINKLEIRNKNDFIENGIIIQKTIKEKNKKMI